MRVALSILGLILVIVGGIWFRRYRYLARCQTPRTLGGVG